ncbi:hypothetical protein KI387_002273, partial [Taxus chinensis]
NSDDKMYLDNALKIFKEKHENTSMQIVQATESRDYNSNSASGTLQLRVITNWNGLSPQALLEIVGDGLEWQCILDELDYNSLELEWHFYDMKMKFLDCFLCESYVSAPGECGCYDVAHYFSSNQTLMRIYRDTFLELIRSCIQTGTTSPSQVPQNVHYNWTTANTALQQVYFPTNGVVISYYAWLVGQNTVQLPTQSILSNITAAMTGNGLNALILRVSSETETETKDANNSIHYTLPLRLKYFREGIFPSTIEIVGDRLDWNQILKDVEMNISSLFRHSFL